MNKLVFLLDITILSLQKGQTKKSKWSDSQKTKWSTSIPHIMNIKQKELVATAHLEKYDMIAVTET